jgi:trehalose/maltose hydrolase-like predicted phosphorylase
MPLSLSPELLESIHAYWRAVVSLGQRDAQGRFRIDGVTGPDEYSAIADNNVVTNLMAQVKPTNSSSRQFESQRIETRGRYEQPLERPL